MLYSITQTIDILLNYLQIKEEDLSPGPEGPLNPPSPFLIVANKFMGGE